MKTTTNNKEIQETYDKFFLFDNNLEFIKKEMMKLEVKIENNYRNIFSIGVITGIVFSSILVMLFFTIRG